ncbi:MAG: hypothetical protein IGR92_14155 [Leptolyngbyaceae cyanobacterium T60_A2020_046]|nr:hypothetical protein [Leptolyngbyaceae cyanobacterium T60_A2020_046]
MAYIFNLPEGPDQLWVSLSAPPEAAQLSVYPPKLNEAGPILEDSRQLIASTPLFQSGFYEVVVVSTRERPFEFTLSRRLERAEPVSPVQPVEPVAPILITP